MKHSTLVMMCSLAGVCAGSAQAGFVLTAQLEQPPFPICYNQSFTYSSGVSAGDYVVLSLNPRDSEDADVDPVDIFTYDSSGTQISGVWVKTMIAGGSRFTMTALEDSTGYFTFLEPLKAIALYSVYSSDGTLIESGALDPDLATDTTAAVSTVTATPAPGAAALLGLAGVFGARRRRN